jgi:ParB/RepB/Spo0J family partition protein
MSRGASIRKTREPSRAKPARARIEEASQHATLTQIPVDRIDVPGRPARRLLGDIAALAESMQDYGLQQPISVRAVGDRYALTSGMRRLAAANMLRWTTISAFVRSVNADDAYLLDLIENLQREDLSPEEEADAFGELLRTRGWTVHQLADSVKRSVGYVSKRVRVFDDPLLREAIAERGLPVSTAEELLAAPPDLRRELVERALAERWDQVRARAAARPSTIEPGLLTDTPGHTAPQRARARGSRGAPGGLAAAVHPRGLTQTIREFHRVILEIRADALTHADRAALRSLFRDLVLLARMPTTPQEPVFPALPKSPAPRAAASRKPHAADKSKAESTTRRRQGNRP